MSTTDVTPPTTHPGSGGRVGFLILVVLGALIASGGFGTIVGGAALAWVSVQQGQTGFLSTPTATLAVDSYAVTSLPVYLGTTESSSDAAGSFATLRVQATPVPSNRPLFIGLARTADVDSYLASVRHSQVTSISMSPNVTRYRESPGDTRPAPPASQGFWNRSSLGSGTQELVWESGSGAPLPAGSWTLVIMNADASPTVVTQVSAGARSDLLAPLSAGLLIAGLIALLVGIAVTIVGAVELGRRQVRLAAAGEPAGIGPYPARLQGALDPSLSRALWLVKWLLVIPHLVLLAFLWFAFAIVTWIAWWAILFTGRYPRALFEFNVGVLRWSWRVAFYGYSALGTDKYPPFTLEKTDYPADFDVAYPARLSRGLIFVKSWLLAIPHLIIVGVFTGSMGGSWAGSSWMSGNQASATGVSLIGLLVVIAAIILLFAKHYPGGLFDFILGINRWVLRVITYVALFRDEYPPFRLDQGPDEPVLKE